METTMDIDELKNAWQTLDRRLDQQHRLNLQIFTETRLAKARSRLRPLFWGQMLQIVAGLLMLLLGVSVWSNNRSVPELLVSGIVIHVYGVMMIAFAGAVLGMIGGIDQAAPVVDIQKRLGRLRSFYVRTGTGIGLAWWLIWIPFVTCFFNWLAGVNFFAKAPSVVVIGVIIGLVGLAGTWWFHRWASSPSRPQLAQRVNDNMTGASLRKAQAEIDEIERFERD